MNMTQAQAEYANNLYTGKIEAWNPLQPITTDKFSWDRDGPDLKARLFTYMHRDKVDNFKTRSHETAVRAINKMIRTVKGGG